MTRADELYFITPDVAGWQAYEPAVKCDCTSTALRFEGRVLLIDPIGLSAAAEAELLQWGKPAFVVCTSANHARGADDLRTRWQIPLAAHPDAAAELGLAIDLPLREGEATSTFPAAVIALPGGAPGEIAIYDSRGVLCLGDAVVHLPQTGFALLPEKYCADAAVLKSSLRKVLRREFRVLTFAHGLPICESAPARLAALLS